MQFKIILEFIAEMTIIPNKHYVFLNKLQYFHNKHIKLKAGTRD